MSITFNLPDDIYRKAEAAAIEAGMNVEQWLTRLVAKELTSQPGINEISKLVSEADRYDPESPDIRTR